MKRLVVVTLCAAVVLAACGRSGSSSSGSTDSTSTTSGSSGAESATFGTETDVCQAGKPSGSPTVGVTPTEIHAAVFSDSGFAGRPGLNQEFFDTAKVFADWCNDRGGINGRKIVVDERDAALTEVKSRMVESCANDLAMVGGGAVFDQDGVQTRLQCLLPDISGFVVSAPARGADLVVQPLPNPTDSVAMGSLNYLDQKFPAATKKVGVLTGDVATTKVTASQMTEAAKSLGWNVVYDDAYPAAGVTDWTPYAQKMKDNGVKGLIFVGDPDALGPLLGAIRDIGYPLDFVRVDANNYDQKLIKNAGTALAPKNVYVQSAFEPFENATPNSATGQYLKAFEQYLPDGKKQTYLGLQAWSSWLLFAKAAKSCGNDLTRRCLYDAAKKIHTWSGGGLHSTSDPGAGKATPCFTVMQATPTGFVVAKGVQPNQGTFNCSPKNVFKLPANEAVHTTLQSVGQNINNMK